MPVAEAKSSLGRARLTFADEADVDQFATTLARFESGEITPDEWRAFRLVRGTYGQRQPDVAMLRVKIPQGILNAAQLEALADVAEGWSRGFGHITTRQNVQFHFMELHDVEKAMRRVGDAGLTTRESCGNAVRNVTACPYAGVSPDEAFDVTPYAEALTRHFLRHPLSSTLPRKFKIAVEGCAQDHALTAIDDLGLRALPDLSGGRAFRVTAGGGTSILCTSGQVLFERLPAGQILDVAEAILRVFHRLGDYKHRQRNRMKFLIKEMGWEAWRAEFERSFAEVRAEGGRPLAFDPDAPAEERAPEGPGGGVPEARAIAGRVEASVLRGPGIRPDVRPALHVLDDTLLRWSQTNVRPQKQSGYSIVTVRVPLGDLTGGQMRALAELASAYGDGTLRTTLEQNLLFRWVRTADVPDLYRRLAAAGLGRDGAGTAVDVTSCPGAEACRLAVTQSRGLGQLLQEHLEARPELVAAAGDLKVKISGCPNGCGLHHVAGIGFQGSVRKLDGKAVPQYFVTVGGGVEGGAARFGRLAAKVPARRAPEAVERLLQLHRRDGRKDESATAFLGRVEIARVREVLSDLQTLNTQDARPIDFVDLAEESPFEPETLAGECSA